MTEGVRHSLKKLNTGCPRNHDTKEKSDASKPKISTRVPDGFSN